MKSVDMVREFQTAFGIEMASEPRLPDQRTRLLRLHLTLEELGELTHALCAGDLVEVLDGLCDLQYINDGTALVCGVGYAMPERVTPYNGPPRLPAHPGKTIKRLVTSVNWLASAFEADVGSLPTLWGAIMHVDESIHQAFADCGMLGIKLAAFAEVHRSNMSKLVDGKPSTDGAGRVQKGPLYSRPDLAQFLGLGTDTVAA